MSEIRTHAPTRGLVWAAAAEHVIARSAVAQSVERTFMLHLHFSGGRNLTTQSPHAPLKLSTSTGGAKTANYSSTARAAVVGATPIPSLQPKGGVVGLVYFQNSVGFTQAAPGTTGMGRNVFQGPWFWDMDGAISKSFQATERVKVTFRAEAFNALNHANYRKLGSTSVGSTSILSSNFGTACCQTQSTSTSTAIVSNGEAYRVVQFVLKASF